MTLYSSKFVSFKFNGNKKRRNATKPGFQLINFTMGVNSAKNVMFESQNIDNMHQDN